MTELHPILKDLIPSIVHTVHRRYWAYVEKADLLQEGHLFLTARAKDFNKQMEEENEETRKHNERRIGWQMQRSLERYARKEKAAKSGYEIVDESYYDRITVGQLLPYVIASVVNDTALEQAQNMINDGRPQRPSAPAEGGNLLAILIDIKQGYLKLEKEEQDILRFRYHENFTLQQIAEYFECAISTADRRCINALRKVVNNLGGESPWQ
jgi:DNA-directed RNA polymerase specialized sigma24 family protein